VHKVTIVPRGRALGITASLPEEDRHSYPRTTSSRPGHAVRRARAEEMIFGAEKITTGAGNDIERATAMARRMVTQFGMSEAIGPMAIGDSEHEVFLGREIGQRRRISENVAESVDAEVKRLSTRRTTRPCRTFEENRPLLETIAEALLERETLDREDIELLAAGEPLPEARVVGRRASSPTRCAARGAPPRRAPAPAPPPGEAGGPARGRLVAVVADGEQDPDADAGRPAVPRVAHPRGACASTGPQ
jgi:cell division protease FtsH